MTMNPVISAQREAGAFTPQTDPLAPSRQNPPASPDGAAAMTGYAAPLYAQSLAEFGQPLELSRCGGWLLERPVPGSAWREDCAAMAPGGRFAA